MLCWVDRYLQRMMTDGEHVDMHKTPTRYQVGLSHTTVNVSQGECGTHLCHEVKVAS